MSRKFAVAAAFVFILAVVAQKPGFAGEAPRVKDVASPTTMLLLGNSFFYYNNSLHNHFRKLTKSVYPDKAKTFFYKSMTISGSYLANLEMSATGMITSYSHKKKKGPWDFVVLQGQSREPINAKKSAGFEKAARSLDATIRKSGARTAFFMTWAYKEKPGMAEKLADAYTHIGNELGALVIPVGLAFDRARKTDPAMELYAEDKKHPSVLGTYLAANVMFATFYGKSPVGAPYTAGLSPVEAKFAQTTAWETVNSYFGR